MWIWYHKFPIVFRGVTAVIRSANSSAANGRKVRISRKEFRDFKFVCHRSFVMAAFCAEEREDFESIVIIIINKKTLKLLYGTP